MWCGFDLSPGPFPGREGESARRRAAGRGLDCGCRRNDEAGGLTWPPCGPPARQGDGEAWECTVRVRAVSWWAGEQIGVRGLAGTRGKHSWRSRCRPAGKDTVAIEAALRRSRQGAPAVMARGGHDPVPSGRHSDSADPAPWPWWPGVRQHPVPLWRHSDGHAPPRAGRREVCHDPVPSAGWLRHHGWPARWCRCVPAGRCPVLQEVLASANPRQESISAGGGGKTTAWRAGWAGLTPWPPLHHVERGCRADLPPGPLPKGKGNGGGGRGSRRGAPL